MCFKTIHKKDGSIVPCGRCPKCIARRVSAWSFRLQQEEKVSSSANFLTLTYDQNYVPFSPNLFHTLAKRDLQLFFKRLRKQSTRDIIKYYAVGEYGGKTKRPHYHVLAFDADVEKVESAWGLGEIHNGTVTGASIGYCLKYMQKNKRRFKYRDDDDRVPEFAVMSKGIGSSYINDTSIMWHYEDLLNRMYLTTYDGVKLSMPRYYKDKLYADAERRAIADAYAIINHEKFVEKVTTQSFKEFRNEQAAIDAAYDKMYSSSLKSCI